MYGPGNYEPPIEAIYWSMRGMAYAGSFVALVALVGAFLHVEAAARAAQMVPLDRSRDDCVPVHRVRVRLVPDRDRAAAVDRAGTAEDRRARTRPRSSTTWLGISLGVFVALYAALLVLDIWLMRRYAGRDPSAPARSTAARRRPRRSGTDGSPEPLVRADRRPLVGLLPARGLRLRGRDAAPVPAPRRRGARRDVRSRSGRSGTATRSGS